METRTYNVSGMSCGGCAASVTRAIQASDATAQVTVELDASRIIVAGELSLDQVRSAVERAGFEFRGEVE